MKFEVTCGTRRPDTFWVDLDAYGKYVPTNADAEIHSRAFNLLVSTMNDVSFADDGHRNNDAVNGCIALHVMGYDAASWFYNFCKEQSENLPRWFPSDLDNFMEHVERVAPYLSSWGPSGKESLALNYII